MLRLLTLLQLRLFQVEDRRAFLEMSGLMTGNEALPKFESFQVKAEAALYVLRL